MYIFFACISLLFDQHNTDLYKTFPIRAAESRGQKLGHVAKMPQIRAPFQKAEGTSEMFFLNFCAFNQFVVHLIFIQTTYI